MKALNKNEGSVRENNNVIKAARASIFVIVLCANL
jgi:hypothetical protein